MDRSQFAVLVCVGLLAATAVYSKFGHHKPKVVTSTVTSPAPRQLEFKPFAYYGDQPHKFVPVPKGWQPDHFGRVAVKQDRNRYVARPCYRLRRHMPPSGLLECDDFIFIWI
jgi:hypothetical protein